MKKAYNQDGENLLCLAVVTNDENGYHTIKSVEVIESYNSGESRKVELK